ncbi:UDP-N-acetylmuramate:L-alanyl-gamma-D-glutamyl-meso-diaminopimelate ligase [Desulfatitalea alkaliphila]|uniref:UDP-N-acetylmuramate:L-alanyl-gamma-D-glutamyl-meso-diaminopimelate ligase n=1 Tax=Desulfatitalea alkaliphila TaxID=2929485 RepID=A0AA41R7X3_9BACT|nr:UDP-N-acetylmuramate:L-alanyl-gamma-D-glutamyl-meso-diaminopimelate ligase [Desulfatitalea alkaliphila]MCJ8502865.1 UDP-N-acetylmuramate:L-alanyl-gamma-D-glutamyl-meso-diaminopimelate ligase [Desulfatitalea alkaliphila]
MVADEVPVIPGSVKSVHLIAVCGTAMGALACMLKAMGYAVTGSDQHVYPPMSDFLRLRGIVVQEGFKSEHLAHRPDLVVVGNAVRRDNPEAVALSAMGLPFCSMPMAINRFAAAGKRQIVITGTHGKTTTSAFIAWLLHCASLDPSFLIGGIVTDFDSNFRVGQGTWMVLEGDEYDTAFFDKGPKFLHYTPHTAVLTSIEFDHADIFTDLDHIKRAFRTFVSRLSSEAALVAFDQDVNVDEMCAVAPCQVISYGFRPDAAWSLGEITVAPPFTRFDVHHQGAHYARFKTRMIGRHNLANLLAGVAVAHRLGIAPEVTARALESFGGVRRRQQLRGVRNDIVVLDDFAHHPTAVRETVQAVKTFYGERRLIAVFEPRTNSSRRNIFQSVYPTSFDAADEICIRQAPMLEQIPPEQRFSSARLVADLQARGKQAQCFADTDLLLEWLVAQARPGDVVLIMSNGGFDNIHARLLERL